MNHQPNEQPLVLLRDWKSLMDAASRAWHSRAHTQAMQLHQRALTLAQALMTCTATSEVADDDRVAAFVVTHLNLADLLDRDGQTLAAGECLCNAHCFLLALLNTPDLCASLHGAVARHLRETHLALMAHVADHGEHAHITHSLRAAQRPMASSALH